MNVTAQPVSMRAGDFVEVRSFAEIARSLDAKGTLGGLPFMPEMLAYCGGRFRVRVRATKLCIETNPVEIRSFGDEDVVLLEDLRCAGAAHGGCQRACALLWRIAWLQPAMDTFGAPATKPHAPPALPTSRADGSYFCQATALRGATVLPTKGTRLRQLWSEWRQRDISLPQVLTSTVGPQTRKLWRRLRGLHPRGVGRQTPSETLGLQAGERVVVKSLPEIIATLDPGGRNRGLSFEPDMMACCGRTYTVRNRVDRLVHETSGRMMALKNTVVLESVTCRCHYVFAGCRRAELQFWREIWLRRASQTADAHGGTRSASPSS